MAEDLEKKMKKMTGFCSACGEEILTIGKNGKRRANEKYRLHTVELSNETIMQVGVCDQCKIRLSSGKDVKKTADAILDNHKIYWAANPIGSPKDFKKLKIVNPNTDLFDFKRKMLFAKHKIEVAKQLSNKEKNL